MHFSLDFHKPRHTERRMRNQEKPGEQAQYTCTARASGFNFCLKGKLYPPKRRHPSSLRRVLTSISTRAVALCTRHKDHITVHPFPNPRLSRRLRRIIRLNSITVIPAEIIFYGISRFAFTEPQPSSYTPSRPLPRALAPSCTLSRVHPPGWPRRDALDRRRNALVAGAKKFLRNPPGN